MEGDSYFRGNPYSIFVVICLVALFTFSLLFIHLIRNRADAFYGTTEHDNLATRGSILLSDNEGSRVLGATLESVYHFILSPYDIVDKDEVFGHLNHLLGTTREEFDKLTEDEESQYEVLKHNVSRRERRELESYINRYDLSSLRFAHRVRRYYPFGELGAQVIGFVSTDDGRRTEGRYGIENSFDETLQSGLSTTGEMRGARDVLLTIDVNIQRELERQMRSIVEDWGPELVGGIVMEPDTGRVVAMGTHQMPAPLP